MPAVRRLAVLLAAGGLSACGSDYGIERKRTPDPGAEDTAPIYDPGIDTGTVEANWCDEPPLTAEVGRDESCAHDPDTDPIVAVVEWEMRSFGNYGEYSEVLMAPMVAQLTDDDADGDIDRDDLPDIVLVSDDGGLRASRRGILRILPGDGSHNGMAVQRVDLPELQVYPYRYSNVAIGDVTGDGSAEIVVVVQVVGGAIGDGGGGDDGGGSDTAEPGDEGGGGEDGGGGAGGDGDVPVRPEVPDGGTGTAAMETPCYLAAFDTVGGLDWVADHTPFRCGGHAPALADLDSDGDVEVIVGAHVFDGGSGEVVWIGAAGAAAYPAHPEVGWHSVPMDLDLDGQQELLTGRTIYASNGDVICSLGGEETDGFVAGADLDLDGVGEVVSVGGGRVRVFERDCTLIGEWALSGGGNGGPPTIADFDVDGRPEIGVADAGVYAVYEVDGTTLWSRPVQDASSQMTGSVVFDFEADGRPEVVYADETRLWIFNGLDGEVRLSDENHASRTLHEFPTVADVDGDGQVELIVPNGGGHEGEDSTGITVFGGDPDSERGGWVSGRQLWNQHAYSITNIADDLSIPTAPNPNWPTWNSFRSGDVNPQGAGSSPDAVPVAEVCLEECQNGRVVVHARLGNRGAVGLRYDVPMGFYAEDVAGERTWLATAYVPDVVDVGGASRIVRVSLDAARLENQSLVVIADDDQGVGIVDECSEENNQLVVEDVTCP